MGDSANEKAAVDGTPSSDKVYQTLNPVSSQDLLVPETKGLNLKRMDNADDPSRFNRAQVGRYLPISHSQCSGHNSSL